MVRRLLRALPKKAMPFLRQWAWVGLSLVYGITFSILALRLYAAFHTYAHDMGQFDQAIWNTAQGRFMVNTIKPPNSMAWHFSPGLALFALLYRIWADARLLLLAQVVALTLSGVPLYLYARRHLGGWALLILAGYYLAPGLQLVSLMEFRRISLAVPAIALAWYGLVMRRPWLAALALLFALLFKEDVALLVIPFGLYLALVSKSMRKQGIGLVLGGIAWLAVALFVFFPLFRGENGPAEASYPQLGYFSFLEDKTSAEAIGILLRQPGLLIGPILKPDRLRALFQVFWPMALLPLLAPDMLALGLPTLMVLQASTVPKVFQLRDWYVAPLLPVFYGAAIVALSRLPSKVRPWGATCLLLTSLAGFYLYSSGPGGRSYNPTLYQVELRDKVGATALRAIPPDVSVSAQSGLVTHVAHRQKIYEFPVKEQEVDYVALDLGGNLYPMKQPGYAMEVKQMLADPTWSVQQDCSGFLVLQRNTKWSPDIERHVGVEGMTEFLGFDWAVSSEDGGCYTNTKEPTLSMRPGQTLRLTLYWQRTFIPIPGDYRVFTHLENASGTLASQHDGEPGDVNLWPDVWAPIDLQRTSQWQSRQVVRDIHYLSVPQGTQADKYGVYIGWYDPASGERASTTNEGRTRLFLGYVLIGK